mgnify:CR=1 FL=1
MSDRVLVRALLGIAFGCLLGGCGQPPSVELWVLAELRDDAELSQLDFSVLDAQVQPAGFEVFADHRVSEEWLQLEIVNETIDLVAAQSEPILVARGDVAVGDYDRVFLRPSGFTAADGQGRELVIKNVMEPVGVSFSYDQARTLRVVLEVIAIATRGDEDYSVFAKSTTVQ